jgi:hypothetical protein
VSPQGFARLFHSSAARGAVRWLQPVENLAALRFPVDSLRLPQQPGVSTGRLPAESPCPHCSLALRIAGIVPVLAWLTGAARCGELVPDRSENRMESAALENTATVSLRADVPEPLLQSMQGFIESHPNWDQYRLVQAALAGFLVQNGVQSREITRCYLANLFPQQPRFSEPLG